MSTCDSTTSRIAMKIPQDRVNGFGHGLIPETGQFTLTITVENANEVITVDSFEIILIEPSLSKSCRRMSARRVLVYI